MEFEKVFPELCSFGKYQKLIFFFVLLPAQLSYYCHIYSHLFMTYQAPHWCKIDHLVDKVVIADQSQVVSHTNQHHSNINPSQTSSRMDSLNTTFYRFPSESLRSNEILRRYFFVPSLHTVPSQLDQQASHVVNMSKLLSKVNYSLMDYIDTLSTCSMFNESSEQLAPFHNHLFPLLLLSNHSTTLWDRSSFDKHNELLIESPSIVTCTDWTFNRTWLGGDESIVTKWNLVCGQEWFQLVALSALLVGLFVGFPLCYFLAHSLGHRRTYFVMLLAQCAAGTLSAFVVDFRHFCLLRFVIGFSLAATATVPTDLMVEMSGVRVMEQIVFYNESIRLIGALLLALVAYFIHDYRHLSIAISVPFIVFCFLWWSFPESTNHLLVTGQIGLLEKSILDIAHTNLAFIDSEFDESIKRRIYTELAIYREFMISSLMADSFARLDQYINYIDFNSAGAEEATMMLKDWTPFSESAQTEQSGIIKESSLVDKLTQHLEKKDLISIKSPIKTANGSVPIQAEIWSEADSDTELEQNKPNPSSSIGNGHLKNGQVLKDSQSSSSNSNLFVSPNNNISTSNETSKLSNGALKERTTLSAIFTLPNMRRKLIVLLFLSATHFSMYINFTYFIEDFIDNQLGKRTHRSARPSNLHILFIFAICLNLISVLLTYLCLHYKFGRKFTFLLTNLLASIFTLLTGLSMSSPLENVTNRHNFDEWKHHLNTSIVFYSIAKIFQASAYLILLIWLYELLPPIAECSAALHTCFTVANLQLVFMPLLLYSAKKSFRLSVFLPDVVVEVLPKSYSATAMTIPVHYLFCTVLLSLSGLLCLVLPETGSIERLPCSLHEAELFYSFTPQSSSDSSNSPPKWHSLKVLFNFHPPNIRPISGILKKPQVSVRTNGKLRNGKRKFLFNSSVEEKIASMSKDCANKTAFNSLYNQFSSGNVLPVDYELAYQKHSKGNINGRHQSANWMSAVADAAATGVPLFVPAKSHSHTHSDPVKPSLSHVANVSHQSVEIDGHQRLGLHHHETFSAAPTYKGKSATLSMQRRHSIEDGVIFKEDNYQHQHHYPQQQSISHSKDWKIANKTGSNAELAYMAAVMDIPYHQNQFQSLPRVNPLSPLELWDDLRNEEQVIQWLNSASWNPQMQHSPNSLANHLNGNKVRVLDIVDTNRGISGQIDTYLDHESSYYPNSLTQPEDSMPDSSRSNVIVQNSEPTNCINDLPDFGLIEDEVNFTDSHNLCHSLEVDAPSAFIALDL